jgi:hypothetical protein
MPVTASAEIARRWLASLPRERQRWEEARRSDVPPPGVQLLAPGLAVLAGAGACGPAQRARLADTAAAVGQWLAGTLGAADGASGFPAVLVHLDPAHALTPRAYLYPDGGANRVTLGDGEINPEHLIHELVHALSDLRHPWSSELLAYHGGFTGLDGRLPTSHRRALATHDISLEDILHHGMPWSRCLAVEAPHQPPGLVYEPSNPYSGLLLAHLFTCLRQRSGGAPALAAYLRLVDRAAAADGGAAAGEAFFEEAFAIDRRAFVAQVLAALAAPRSSPPARDHDLGVLRDTLRDVQRRWWTDTFELVYPRTALARHQHHVPDGAAALLYLDYRVYLAQRAGGAANATALRHLLRTSARLLQTHPASVLAVCVRYFLLTDHALDQYRGRMALLPHLDADLSRSLRAIVDQLAVVPGDHLLATVARGHFHLFYSTSLGADPQLGVRLLEEVLESDPLWEEAYLHLANHFARAGDQASVRTWIDRYRAAVADPRGPTLLAQLRTSTNDSATTSHRRKP